MRNDIDALATMAASTLLVAVTFYEDVTTPVDALRMAQDHVRDAWEHIQALAAEAGAQ
jgi:hypothetical protein